MSIWQTQFYNFFHIKAKNKYYWNIILTAVHNAYHDEIAELCLV
jgi:hypothetical protein